MLNPPWEFIFDVINFFKKIQDFEKKLEFYSKFCWKIEFFLKIWQKLGANPKTFLFFSVLMEFFPGRGKKQWLCIRTLCLLGFGKKVVFDEVWMKKVFLPPGIERIFEPEPLMEVYLWCKTLLQKIRVFEKKMEILTKNWFFFGNLTKIGSKSEFFSFLFHFGGIFLFFNILGNNGPYWVGFILQVSKNHEKFKVFQDLEKKLVFDGKLCFFNVLGNNW